MKHQRIVVTGLGVVSSIGMGWRAFWDSLLAGRSGIRAISYLDTSEYPTRYGGEVPDFDPLQFMSTDEARRVGRGTQFAIAATKMALEDSYLSGETARSLRVGVCFGTTMADIQSLESINSIWVRDGEKRIQAKLIPQYPSCSMSASVAKHFGLVGPNFMIPTACSAGNYAISYAVDLLRSGKADLMVAGGADPFSEGRDHRKAADPLPHLSTNHRRDWPSFDRRTSADRPPAGGANGAGGRREAARRTDRGGGGEGQGIFRRDRQCRPVLRRGYLFRHRLDRSDPADTGGLRIQPCPARSGAVGDPDCHRGIRYSWRAAHAVRPQAEVLPGTSARKRTVPQTVRPGRWWQPRRG